MEVDALHSQSKKAERANEDKSRCYDGEADTKQMRCFVNKYRDRQKVCS